MASHQTLDEGPVFRGTEAVVLCGISFVIFGSLLPAGFHVARLAEGAEPLSRISPSPGTRMSDLAANALAVLTPVGAKVPPPDNDVELRVNEGPALDCCDSV